MGPDGKKPSGPSSTPSVPSSTEYQLKKYLLLLATLVATVTYAAGLNLPGGVWQDTKDGHLVGDLILHDTHYHRYLTFYYCNATAFAASVVVCLLLLILDSESKPWAAALRVLMVLDLLGLMGAYAAGSCRDAFTTIYSSVIMSAVLAYIAIAFFVYVFSKKQGEDSGGFWSNSQDGHRVSNPVLQEHNSSRYQAFFVCNTTAFVSSLLIIILLLDKKLILSLPANKLSGPFVRFLALYVFIIIALFGLVGAYAAGSCRELDTTTYVVCLIGVVLGYIFLQVAITKAIPENATGWLKNIKELFVESSRGNEALGKDEASEAMERAKTNEASKRTNKAPVKANAKESRNSQANEALEKARNLVILLATLVASITYQAGLDPPGGLWPDDQDGHKGGDPILLTTHPTRYKVFFYSNSAAFVASLIVITMVQSSSLLKRHTLEAAMLLDLFGLIGAYAAGSAEM